MCTFAHPNVEMWRWVRPFSVVYAIQHWITRSWARYTAVASITALTLELRAFLHTWNHIPDEMERTLTSLEFVADVFSSLSFRNVLYRYDTEKPRCRVFPALRQVTAREDEPSKVTHPSCVVAFLETVIAMHDGGGHRTHLVPLPAGSDPISIDSPFHGVYEVTYEVQLLET